MPDSAIRDKVVACVNSLEAELIERLQTLVRIPSVTGDEHDVQVAVQRQFDELGLAVDMWEPDASELEPWFEDVGHFESLAGRPNVVGTRRGSGDGRSLILNAHIDVVDPGDRTFWDDDPYGGVVRDGQLWGRGSCDMKAGLVAEIIALRALDELGIRLKGDVLIESVISEEDGGAGALATILRGHTADAAIITEPTQLAIIPAQGGSLVFRMTIDGLAAHACVRNEGVSALEKFIPIHAALLQLERDHHEQIDHPLYTRFDNRAPINIGTVQAGTWPSSVPESIVVEGRAGLVPGESLAETRTAFLAAIDSVVAQDPWLQTHPPRFEWFSGQFTAAEIPLDHALIGVVGRAHSSVTGKEAQLDAATYGADLRHFVNAGNIPCVMYGPGDVRLAHRPNEHVPIDEVLIAAQTLAMTMIEWCSPSD